MADAAPDTPQMVADALACCVARWREEGACRRGGRYDILVYEHAMRAVAVSGSGGDADSRAASYLGPDMDMAAAVIVPEGWDGKADVSYAVHRASPRGRRRFPDRGFIGGSVCNLAHMIQAVAAPGRADGADGMVATLVGRAADSIPEDAIPASHGPTGQHARMMTALLWLDGILALRREGGPGTAGVRTIISEWRRTERDGGAPVFGPAVDALERMGESAGKAVAHLQTAADTISDAGPDRAARLGADLLPSMSADRQTAAEYYTREAVAGLLAGLVISEDDMPDWSDDSIFQRYRLADLACGTGTLLRAGFERVRALHESRGGTRATAARLHRDAVRSGITGVDVYPAAAHMAASSLAAVMPQEWGGETAIGWMGVGGPEGYTGSIELAGADHMPDAGMSGRVATGPAARRPVSIPDRSCDWIIMNPPYSRTRIGRAAFDIAGLSASERARCQGRWRDLIHGEPARKTAGMAATYVVIAGKKIKPGGRMGFVLPVSASSVEAWSDTRHYIERNFTDILAVAVGGRRSGDSLSEDTSIGEMLLVAKKLEEPRAAASPIHCATLYCHPAGTGEAGEVARAMSSALNRMKESGAETYPIIIGSEAGHIYKMMPDGRGSPWSPLGVMDMRLARAAIHAARGRFCPLDGASVPFAARMAPMREVFGIGPTHHMIGHRPGKLPLGAFEIVDGRGADMFMWTASSKRQTGLVMEPTHTGRAGSGPGADRERMRQQSSTLFYTRRIGWNGQRLLAASTAKPCMGGNAWTALMHDDTRVLRAAALWFNSTLGMLVHWTQGQRTQSGRSNTEMRALKEIPCPRFCELDGHILDAASDAFAALSECALLPASRSYEDPVRREIDVAVCSMMGLPGGALAEMCIMRNIFCREPTVGGQGRRRRAD